MAEFGTPETLNNAQATRTVVEAASGTSGRLQRIARHVLDQPDDLALDTISVIAERANVHPSAIVRFAKAMGFAGASAMQRLLREGLLASHATPATASAYAVSRHR